MSRKLRPFVQVCAVVVALTLGQAGGSHRASAAAERRSSRPPNVIVILADDLGHNDISLNGNPLIRTPNIDAIAHQGMTFATGYAGDAVCAPSRAALLTGRDPERFGFEFLPHEQGFARNVATLGGNTNQQLLDDETPDAEINGLPKTEQTLGDLMRTRGYHTAIVGKWHLGTSPSHNPLNRGFDEFLGITVGACLHAAPNTPGVVDYHLPNQGNDRNLWLHATHMIRRGLGQPYEAPGYMSDVYADEATRIIHDNRNKPFFLYLAFDEPHMPLQGPKRFYDQLSYIKDEKTRVYYAMIEAMDASVGRVMTQLKKEGIDDNTLVIFTSDNGGSPFPQIPQMNLPYRGWKLTYFEGGLNVPYFARWPGHIAPGSVLTGAASHLDIVPTAVAAAGGRLPTDRVYDGQDLLPALTGGASGSLGERELVWRKDKYWAIRKGDYKLQVLDAPQKVWLYDMHLDPTERINIADANPAKVAELRTALSARTSQFKDSAWKPQGRLRVDVDPTPEDHKIPREFIIWTN